MKEIIEILNHTSAARTVFYAFIFLASLGIVSDMLTDIITVIFDYFKSRRK